MDIVLVNPYLDGVGGAEKIIIQLAKRFNAPIYTLKYDRQKTYPEFAELDVRIAGKSALEIPLDLFAPFEKTRALTNIARAGFRYYGLKIKDDYDVISAHSLPSECIRNRNERVCWHWHGLGFFKKLDPFFQKQMSLAEKLAYPPGLAAYRAISGPLSEKIEKITVCSEFVNADLVRSTGRHDGEVIWTGVDERLFIGEDYGKYFIYPARITPQKRIEFAIDAFRRFKRRGWKLVVVGPLSTNDPVSTGYLDYLKDISRGCNVEFHTNLSQLEFKKLFANCSALLFTPKGEGSGTVLLEAMALCKPCIVVDEGGPHEVIENGRNGFIISSPEEMAKKMEFLADRPDECERMGKEGRKIILKNYTWKVYLSKMKKVYREAAKM